MSGLSEKDYENIISMRNSMQEGLKSIELGSDWLKKYETWKSDDRNSFEALLRIKDPFNLSHAGESNVFDATNNADMIDLDCICMSIFLAEELRKYTMDTYTKVKKERGRYGKKALLEEYFQLIEMVIDNKDLAFGIVVLERLAREQMVLHGSRNIDIYDYFFSLKENLRLSSTESLYLLYTYWRITKNRKDLKRLITSVVDYIQTYFYEYDKDPEMRLSEPLNGLISVRKLERIEHWLELITFHTERITEKYKNWDWLSQIDSLADHIIETNQISRYEMMQYKRIFSDEENEVVRKKAICYHSYLVWIKTVDLMYIVCDVFQMLHDLSEEELRKMNTTKYEMLECYDNMIKIRDRYTDNVFFHRVYYNLERHYVDSRIVEALERDAELISESVDDVIGYIDAIASDDIEGLLQAKQSYICKVVEFTDEEQKRKLDELTASVVDKIKIIIQKTDAYEKLYNSVSNDFVSYAAVLLQHPQILSSLVSAEYLFRQYVHDKVPNSKFDYSGICIMYYMSLEDFLNKIVYTPYVDEVLSKIEARKIRDSEWQRQDALAYVSSFSSFWDKHRRIKRSCEIGVLGFLFEAVNTEIYFRDFLEERFDGIDIAKVEAYGKELKRIAPRRNDAAHGGNYLTHVDACTDKDNVYNAIRSYKGMIIELLEMCYKC